MKKSLILLGLGTTTLLTAYTPPYQPSTQQQYDQGQGNQPKTQTQPNSMTQDQAISEKLSAIVHSAWLARGDQAVSFSISNGVVILKGNVHSKDDIARIEDSIRKIPGIKSVQNQIVISDDNASNTDKMQASSDEDTKEGEKIGETLKNYPNISYDVKDGVVYLSGTAKSPEEVGKIESLVKNVDGVHKVYNHIVRAVPDQNLRENIQGALTSPEIGASCKYVNYSVNHGAVTLNGTVESPEAQCTVGDELRKIPGVVQLHNQTSVGVLCPSDQQIDSSIKTLLAAHPGSFSNVNFHVKNGFVDMYGTLPSSQVQQLESSVKKISGVRDVYTHFQQTNSNTALTDNTSISGNLSATDQDIHKQIKDIITPGLISNGYPTVTFTVSDGVVTLTGLVDKLDDKTKLEDSIKKINGVKSVNSHIQVGAKTALTDDTNVKALSASDQAVYKKVKDIVSPGLISKGYPKVTFTISTGVVTLTGSVDKLDDKAKLQDAIKKIDGVKQVNDNLQVATKTALTDDKSTKVLSASDQAVYKKVKDAVSPGLISRGYPNVTFAVAAGVVTLTGTVDNLDDKTKVQETVKKIDGVKQVNNNLQVVTKTALTDASNMESASATDQAIYKKITDVTASGIISKGYPNVTYSVNSGVVSLKGSVDNLDDKNKLQDAVKKIDGVTQVINQITVKTNVSDNGYATATAATAADLKLNEKIQNKLGKQYSKLVITSSKGVVTVSGEVMLSSEVTKVQNEIKSVSGVKTVVNQLTVRQ